MSYGSDQRESFITIALELGCKVHAVVLDLDPQLCSSRVAQRENHEGGVQGNKDKWLVSRSYADLAKNGPPTASEGIESVQICNSPSEVQKVIKMWKTYSTGISEVDDSVQGIHWSAALSSSTGGALTNWLWTQRGGSKKPGKIGRKQDSVMGKGQNRKMTVAANLAVAGLEPQRATNAFKVMMDAARQNALELQQRALPDADISGLVVLSQTPVDAQEKEDSKKDDIKLVRDMQTLQVDGSSHQKGDFGYSWQQSLFRIAMNPERFRKEHPEMLVDNMCLVIKDAYPKAIHHYLVISRDRELASVRDLSRENIAHLQHMQRIADQWIEGLAPIEQSQFLIGFHSLPSMRQLHLHVISDDFESKCLKNKKHWNSFTTPFFLPLLNVLSTLMEMGSIKVNRAEAEGYLKWDLRCHRCRQRVQSMPILKDHIQNCSKSG